MKKKDLLENEYLYGSGVVVPKIPEDVINIRLELLNSSLSKILDHSYHIRDNDRVAAILKAIDFWSKIK